MLQRTKRILAIVAVMLSGTLWSTPASAGCAKIGGVQMCASWITGSEVQLSTITGLGNIRDTCPAGSTTGTEGCPLVTATAFGTDGQGNTDTCKTNRNCAIYGTLYCVNPASNARKAQGQPFALDSLLTDTEIVDSSNCSRNGKCTTEVPLEPDFAAYNPCVNSNWKPIAFVASEFFGESKLKWIDSKGFQQTLTILDYCEATLPGSYNPGQVYTCTQLPLP